ncbi:hypothetical protein RRG08_002789 [Elysia crispata]|uniref:Uncharacterized protein n=1 Tax=Elysia crispata TaxID=231223 RepID=A0AAE0XU23_9GAST|nr:hypothetical protein RRG08_002789 [Elysia crispata]
MESIDFSSSSEMYVTLEAPQFPGFRCLPTFLFGLSHNIWYLWRIKQVMCRIKDLFPPTLKPRSLVFSGVNCLACIDWRDSVVSLYPLIRFMVNENFKHSIFISTRHSSPVQILAPDELHKLLRLEE